MPKNTCQYVTWTHQQHLVDKIAMSLRPRLGELCSLSLQLCSLILQWSDSTGFLGGSRVPPKYNRELGRIRGSRFFRLLRLYTKWRSDSLGFPEEAGSFFGIWQPRSDSLRESALWSAPKRPLSLQQWRLTQSFEVLLGTIAHYGPNATTTSASA